MKLLCGYTGVWGLIDRVVHRQLRRRLLLLGPRCGWRWYLDSCHYIVENRSLCGALVRVGSEDRYRFHRVDGEAYETDRGICRMCRRQREKFQRQAGEDAKQYCGTVDKQ